MCGGRLTRRIGQAEIGGIALLILVITLLPYRYLTIGGSPPFLIQFLPLFIITALLASLVARGMPLTQNLMADPLLLPIAAVLTIDVLSAMGGVTVNLSLQKIVYYAWTGPLVYLLVRYKISEFPSTRGILLCVVGFASGVAALYGISEYWVGRSWLFGEFLELSNPSYSAMVGQAVFVDRVMGTVGHPVALGAFLLLCLPASIFLACQGGSVTKILGVASSVATAAAIFLTLSRGAWVGLLAAVVFYLVYQKKRLAIIIVSSLVILAGVLVSSQRLLSLVKARNPVQSMENFRENSRVKAYSYVAQIVPQYLYLGSGTGTYHILAKPRGSFLNTPDNMYLMRLVETGVLGLIAWICLLQRGARVLAGNAELAKVSSEAPDRFPGLLLAGLVGFLVDMCTFDALYFPATRIMFWMLMGIGCSSARSSRARE